MNYNYTLLLILSILLLIQCYVKSNINIITTLLLGILLISNEIYKKREFFNYNPYLYSPEGSLDNIVPISDGVKCIMDKNLKKYQQQKDKLNQQNKIINMIQHNITSDDKKNKALLKDNDLSVFDPIAEIKDNTECPTTCHLITNSQECNKKLDHPINLEIQNMCESIEDKDDCNNSCHCKYDESNEKCNYNKLGCIWLKSSEQTNTCHKRCDKYDNKNECNLASGNNINDKDDLYCDWDSINNSNIGNCITKCEKYTHLSTCISDESCEINNDQTQCQNKCDSIMSSQICNRNSHCKFSNNKCENK